MLTNCSRHRLTIIGHHHVQGQPHGWIYDQGGPWSTMVSRNFIRFDNGQPKTTMVDNGQPFWQWTIMVRTMTLSWYLIVDHELTW